MYTDGNVDGDHKNNIYKWWYTYIHKTDVQKEKIVNAKERLRNIVDAH